MAPTIDREFICFFGLQPASFFQRSWIIVTSLFIHNGLWHIIADIFALHFFGNYLSRLIGEIKLLITYSSGGILGSILFIFLALSYSTVIGISRAFFTLSGTFTVIKPKLRLFIFPTPVPFSLWSTVIGGFLIFSFIPGIA